MRSAAYLARSLKIVAALWMIALAAGCGRPGTANTRVGAVCTTKRDCESVCWEGSCTLACQRAEDCPAKMTCIDQGVCLFTCLGDRECGGWECIDKRLYGVTERVTVCVPRFGGGDPNDYEPDPDPEQMQP